MHKGPIVSLMVVAVLALSLAALAGCGDSGLTTTTTGGGSNTTDTTADDTTNSTVSDGGVQMAVSPIARVTASAPRADILSVSKGMNAFGTGLYAILTKSAGSGNVVFSPASIEIALAMTYAGANGDTAAEMAKALHFALQGDALHQGFNSLDSLLESRNWQGKTEDGKDEGVVLKTANSLWGHKDLSFEKVFLDTLAKDYGAGMRLVDYKTAAEDARVAINKWVADQTNDKIKDLVPQGALDDMTRLVLVNAVYLDATWASQFDKAATHDGDFTTLAGPTVTASMMAQEAAFRYAKDDGWQAVELPYAHDQLAMLLVVPDQGRFAEVEARLGSGLLDRAAGALADAGEVDLTMPKFKFRTQASLPAALKALGMSKAFDPLAADFSGMTTQEPLYISDVIHEAYIAVDEEGTEAAAATAVVMRTASAPAQTVQLTIDRPFLFALRDLDTGAVLFLGRVTDPTAA